MRKPSSGFPTGYETNWAVQPQKMARDLKGVGLQTGVLGPVFCQESQKSLAV